nr:endonuclease domain-containing protein [Sphingomonas sp.]
MRRPEVYVARRLRRTMSLPEALLWEALRGSRAGAKFRRQHPIGPYIVDFCCRATSLVIEVDGEVHGRGDLPERDADRDRFLADNGYRVWRIAAAEILHNLDSVIAAISADVAAPLHHALHGPPPRAGED